MVELLYVGMNGFIGDDSCDMRFEVIVFWYMGIVEFKVRCFRVLGNGFNFVVYYF